MYGIRVSFRGKIHANITIFLYVNKIRRNLHKKKPRFLGAQKNLISYVKFVYLPSKAFTSSIMFSFT